jgi:hypothetical protein
LGELFGPLKVVYNHNHPSEEICMHSKAKDMITQGGGERRRKEKREASV